MSKAKLKLDKNNQVVINSVQDLEKIVARRRSVSVYKMLKNIFSNSTIFRHSIDSNDKLMYSDYAKKKYRSANKFFRETANFQFYNFGNWDRMARYADYDFMEHYPITAAALDIYANEMTAPDTFGNIIKISSEDKTIKETLETLFLRILNVENGPLWFWCRNLCKYGDTFLFLDINPINGISNVLPLTPRAIELIWLDADKRKSDSQAISDFFDIKYRWITSGTNFTGGHELGDYIDKYMLVHFRLQGNDKYYPYGTSALEGARRSWRQCLLLEDSAVTYRVVRAPSRRVFYVNIGNADDKDGELIMTQFIDKMSFGKQVSTTLDSIGNPQPYSNMRYNPSSIIDDYYIPIREGNEGTRIETLEGQTNDYTIDDINYARENLRAALKIPNSYLNWEGDVNAKSTLAQEDSTFGKLIFNRQKAVIEGLNHIAYVHLAVLGYSESDLANFTIELGTSSTIYENQRLNNLSIYNGIAAEMMDNFGRDFVLKNVYKMSKSEIAEVYESLLKHLKMQTEFEKIGISSDVAQGAGGGGMGGMMGGDEGGFGDELGGESVQDFNNMFGNDDTNIEVPDETETEETKEEEDNE